MNRFNVTNYNVQIHTEVNNPVAYNAFIGLNLVATDGSVSTQAVAFLNFYPETTTTPLPDNSVETQGGMKVYVANFRKSWLSAAIDLLRNEQPISLFFDEATKEASLGTGTQESVGEGEK
jgi:hypothetical protein